MKLGFKRGQKGFTLVELMVVMAVMAVLAAIVIPAVTGTKQVSLDAQVTQDASAIESAVGSYNADTNMAEGLTTTYPIVVSENTTTQVISNKWPEKTISAAYAAAFPTGTSQVTSVTIKDKDGITTYGTGEATNKLAVFVAAYNAINIASDNVSLVSQGYLQEEPDGVDLTFASSPRNYANYLWLVKKVYVGDDPDGGRAVEVYSLVTVQTATSDNVSKDSLTYKQIY